MSLFDPQTISALSAPKEAKNLADSSLSIGEDKTIALTERTEELPGYNAGQIGASTSVYINRLIGFAYEVRENQGSFMAYGDTINSREWV